MNHEVIAPNPWMILPFALLAGRDGACAVAGGQLVVAALPKVSLALGAITLGYYFLGLQASARVWHMAHDYISFIALVGSLFVVSGGIHINVKGEATPLANVVFLFIGAVVANVLGTTGAAMLLIRPWIRMNRCRVTAHHIAFFIFIVANVGGCLTPIGDPPLFLGYLQGVPFWWVAKNCWPMWATGVGILLAMFYVVDRINFARAPREVRERKPRGNVAVRWPAEFVFSRRHSRRGFVTRPVFVREALMVAAAIRFLFHHPEIRSRGEPFQFSSDSGSRVLFAGIFATMMPALDWLNLNARGLLGESRARDFFLGRGRVVQRAGQRADVSRFSGRAFRRRPAPKDHRRIAEPARLEPAGHQRRRGVFRRGHLHRQRAELHGQSRRRPAENPHADVYGIRLEIHAAVPVAHAAGHLAHFLSRLKSCHNFETFSLRPAFFLGKYACFRNWGLRVRTLYNILFTIFFVLSSPYYFMRLRRRGNWRPGFRERFGHYTRASNKRSPTAMSFGFTPSASAKSIYARNSSARSNPACRTSKLWCPPPRRPAWANCAAGCPRTSAKFTTRLTGGNPSAARWPSSTPSHRARRGGNLAQLHLARAANWASRFFWPTRGCPTARIAVTNDWDFCSGRSSRRLPASARKMRRTPRACGKSAAGPKPSRSWAT
jgi:hypothetical protein